ncbi:MAG TPA: DUF1398 family protein [Rhizomicrobium sp.]|jgi:uncharacterized protein YbcV (DUF1398 family)|nr:DUF1398 family protein [Rhizomicrobium sp.]
MDSVVKAIVREVTHASDEERITFPEVVLRLAAAGVERYHADLASNERVFYMPDGTFERVPAHEIPRPAQLFSAPGVDAAVRAIQRGEIQYREFCARIAEAGCVGYHVFIAGRRAVYYGRGGDMHVEYFPGATP